MESVINVILPAKNYSGYNENSHMKHMVWLPPTDRVRYQIPCLFVDSSESDILVVFAHGNGMDIGMVQYYKALAKLIGVNMLVWEYPGYGLCRGVVSADGVDTHMERVMEFVVNDMKWSVKSVILYGHSMGTGPSCTMAAKMCGMGNAPMGLILQSAYVSIEDFVSYVAHEVKFDWNKWKNWKNVESIKSVTCPTLILHGDKDNLIPCVHGHALFEASGCSVDTKKKVIFKGVGHNDFNLNELARQVKEFVVRLGSSNGAGKLNVKKYRYSASLNSDK